MRYFSRNRQEDHAKFQEGLQVLYCRLRSPYRFNHYFWANQLATVSDESILFYSISIKMVSFFYCFVTALLVDISSGFQSSCPHNSRCTSQKPWLNYFSGLASATTSETPHTNDSIAKGRSLPSTPPSSNEFNVDYEAYGNGYKTVFSELPFSECKASHGLIPKDLRGSYYRCGPGEKRTKQIKLIQDLVD